MNKWCKESANIRRIYSVVHVNVFIISAKSATADTQVEAAAQTAIRYQLTRSVKKRSQTKCQSAGLRCLHADSHFKSTSRRWNPLMPAFRVIMTTTYQTFWKIYQGKETM